MPAVMLKKDEEIIIEPLSIIPVDCFVLEGHTVVDEATMTGESFPATKTVGSFLMSGTQNISSRIVAVVTAEQHESTLQRLIDNISFATEQSSDASQNVDFIVRHFVAGILLLALFGFSISFYICQVYISTDSMLLLNVRWQFWQHRVHVHWVLQALLRRWLVLVRCFCHDSISV